MTAKVTITIDETKDNIQVIRDPVIDNASATERLVLALIMHEINELISRVENSHG